MTNVTDGNGNNIHIKVDTGGAHGWQVLGTLLGVGGVGAIAWALAQNGLLDFAATGLTMFLVQLVTLMFKGGMLRLPERSTTEFEATGGILRAFWNDYQRFQANSPMWRLALLALGYTAVFMLMRFLLTLALGVFQNMWVAGGLAALLAAFIVAPQMFANAMRGLNTARARAAQTKPAQPATVATAAASAPVQPAAAPVAAEDGDTKPTGS